MPASYGSFFARRLWDGEQWHFNTRAVWQAEGKEITLHSTPKPEAGEPAYDWVIPGISNVHSHAFQWGFAGLAEYTREGADNFWSWREAMYRFARRLNPEQHAAIARYLYILMLQAGYTAVGEFHYLHHQPDGTPYDDPAEMSLQLVEVAAETGIHLTLLPVFYAHSNFGGLPPTEGQKRFIHSGEGYLRLLERLNAETRQKNSVNLGVAPHSLRAVSPDLLTELLAALPLLGYEGCPVHMHVAEQVKEVEDCLAWCGQRPAEWLSNHAPLDERWCFIHATHVTATEAAAMAKAGVVAGLCPTTEGNLGDGIFPAVEFMKQGGRYAIGTDSHVTLNPFEEARMLEYVQRLALRERNVMQGEAPSTGVALLSGMIRNGKQALGLGRDAARADFIALEPVSPTAELATADNLLERLVFTPGAFRVKDVYASGRRVVENGRHALESVARQSALTALKELLA
jgi:formimidoylglutamate deiminase